LTHDPEKWTPEPAPHLDSGVGTSDTASELDYINNQALPRGAARLLVAELKARGLPGWVVNSIEAPRITDQLYLPLWQPRSNYLWPLGK
jgi:hypothetical protein